MILGLIELALIGLVLTVLVLGGLAIWRALQRPEPLAPGEVAAMDRAVRDHVDRALAGAEERLHAALTMEETA